jgi:uncharacterized protein (UPF0332 family)
VTEREALLGKANRYLKSAQLLLESGDYDSAVSRIYYAAFFVAETLLDKLELEFSSHKAVISAYGKEFAQKGVLDAKFHQLLIRAFEKRQQADYMADPGFDRDEVSELLAEARMFLNAATEWLGKL